MDIWWLLRCNVSGFLIKFVLFENQTVSSLANGINQLTIFIIAALSTVLCFSVAVAAEELQVMFYVSKE